MNARRLYTLALPLLLLAAATTRELYADEPSGAAVQPNAIFVMRIDGSELRRLPAIEGFGQFGSPRWSHDGRRLALAAAAAPASTPARVFTIGADGTDPADLGPGEFPAWSPDDKQLAFSAVAGASMKPGTWVENSDRRGREWLADGSAPRWAPDGSRLALLKDKQLVLYDLVAGAAQPLSEAAPANVLPGFDWSPDGRWLALVNDIGPERQLWIVDVAQPAGAKQMRLAGDLDGYVAWSPDAKRLAVSLAGRIHLLDAARDAAPQEIGGQVGENFMPAWSPDGNWMALVSTRALPAAPPAARVASLLSLQAAGNHNVGSIVYGMAFTPDGRRLVAGGDPQNEGMHVVDLTTGEVTQLGGQGIRVAMFPDGKRFATSWIGPLVQILEVETGAVVKEFSHGATVRALAVSRDGRRLVTGGLDKLMFVWDPETGEQLQTFAEHQDWLTQAVFTPDSQEVISADHGKTVRVWNVATGKQRLQLDHPDSVWGLVVSPDGQYALTGTGGPVATSPSALKITQGPDNVIRQWQLSDGALLREMKGHTHAAYALDISPDGRWAASGGWDGSVRLWDLHSGQQLDLIEGAKGRAARVAFTPDGKQLFVGGGGNREANQIVMYPDEQLRVFKIVPLTAK
ncbi:MAG: hypothetical protein AB7O59_05910 [Pirellulales bacterium]